MRTVDVIEPFSTYGLMAKPIAVKFYVPPDLMKRCEGIFKRQGVNLSVGITRLIQLLDEAPEEMKGVILGQAHGDAATVLAENVLRKAADKPAPNNRLNPPSETEVHQPHGTVTSGGVTRRVR